MPEKLQTLLIILAGLVIFVIRMWRKAQETIRREAQERRLPGPNQRPGASRPVRPPGAPSFEELMRQMQEQNRQGQTAPKSVVPAPVETTPGGRPIPRTDVRPARSLETIDRPARSLEEPAISRPARSMETSVTAPRRAAVLPRAGVAHGKEDYWSRKAAASAPVPSTTTAAEVAARLRNPADVRTAFILAEVLQRRY